MSITWERFKGEGHLVVDRATACGLDAPEAADEQDVAEVTDIHARPFGVDTCRACHGLGKVWAADPSKAPDGIDAAPVPAEVRRAMTAEQRRKAIQGDGDTETAAETQDGPDGRLERSRGTEVSSLAPGDDLDFPDEDGASIPVVSGAAFIVPEPKPARRSRAKPADDDGIDR